MGLKRETIGAEVWYGQNLGAFMNMRYENHCVVLRYGEGDGRATVPENNYMSGVPMNENVEYVEVDSLAYAIEPQAFLARYGRFPIHNGASVSGCDLHHAITSTQKERLFPDSRLRNSRFWLYLALIAAPNFSQANNEKFDFSMGCGFLPRDVFTPRDDVYQKVIDITPNIVNEHAWEYGKGAFHMSVLNGLARLGVDLRK